MDEISGEFAGASEELEKGGSFAFGADFTPSKKVAFGDDSCERPIVVYDWDTTNMAAQHNVCRVLD
jgi:hypothetical protein